MSEIRRTRFARDIVAEFLPPAAPPPADSAGRAAGGRTPLKPPRKVIIFCGGMPSVPKKDALLRRFSAKWYWVFLPRYRGSWESGGEFLKISPHQDILDIIDQLPLGFHDLFSGEKIKIKPEKLFVIGNSFGGPAALLVSGDRRVTKVVAISPVIDWRYPSRDEPPEKLVPFVREAFGAGYRGWEKHWRKLFTGKFYNPINNISRVSGRKILIIHAQDDHVCSIIPVRKFSRLTCCRQVILKRGGHLGASVLIRRQEIHKKVISFLKSKP